MYASKSCTCTVCQQQTGSTTHVLGIKRLLYCGHPGQKVAIDFIESLCTTPRSNKCILVITDHITRWADAIPLPYATAVLQLTLSQLEY